MGAVSIEPQAAAGTYNFTQISDLNSTGEPLGAYLHLYLCGFECGEAALGSTKAGGEDDAAELPRLSVE